MLEGFPTHLSLENIDDGAAETAFWHLVFCKPNQELIAQQNLQRQGFHVYLPLIRPRKRRRGKWVNTLEALFPRYLFIRSNPQVQSIAPVSSTRGAIGLVRFGGLLARVSDDLVATIRLQEDEATGLHQDDRSEFRKGAPIRVVEGPLTGMEGIFDQQDGKGRTIVLLELLGKANKIAVRRDWVAKAA